MELNEGQVVYTQIRGKMVYYQILDAQTKEEIFGSNPLGIHVATASQIGIFDNSDGFVNFPWLPEMNHPLFLVDRTKSPVQTCNDKEFFVGKIPSTDFQVTVKLDDLVEYHTAVLGMTGRGKTELAFEIIRNALQKGTKVFCVDFTGEYAKRLSDFSPEILGLNIAEGSELEKKLFAVETGSYGAGPQKIDLKDFLDDLTPRIDEQIDTFLTSTDKALGIFELAEIANSKTTLRVTEMYLSSVMCWAKAHRKEKQILIVLEEAHTIIPEVYGSGFDYDSQWVVSRIGQIALQGRKYGVGLMVVSQRTALVSKTILSQCHTYFTHGLVDKTSLDFLSSVYSSEHVKTIPNLKFLEFLAYGKGVKSERPIITKREFDEAIAAASKSLNSTAVAEVSTPPEIPKGEDQIN